LARPFAFDAGKLDYHLQSLPMVGNLPACGVGAARFEDEAQGGTDEG